MNAVVENAVRDSSSLPAVDPVTQLESSLYSEARSHEPSPLTRLLEVYWRALPGTTRDERMHVLRRIGEAVRSGRQDRSCLAVTVLGDPDDGVVFSATLAYAACGPVPLERRRLALEQVLDWIRRGLATRRHAAFAALLSLQDPEIEELLRPLRLSLGVAEFHAVGATLEAHGVADVSGFMADWAALLAPAGA